MQPDAIAAAAGGGDAFEARGARGDANGLRIAATRLHPLTVVVGVATLVQRYLIPGIVFLMFGGGSWALVAAFSFAFGLGFVQLVARYWAFTFGITGGELWTVHGILSRHERSIPLSRVQDLKLESSFLQRMLGVVSVEVETAGGTEAEVSLRVLSCEQADELRALLHGARAAIGADAAPSPEEVLYAARPGELIVYGLTSARAGVVAIALFFGAWELMNRIPGVDLRLEQIIYGLAERAQAGTASTLLVVGAVSVGVVSSFALSAIGALIMFFGFELVRQGGALRRRYGLITRRSQSLLAHQVQTAVIEENAPRRLLGLASLRAVSAGSSARGGHDVREGRDVVVPIADAADVYQLVPGLLPGGFVPPRWRPISPKALARGFRRGLIVVAGITAVGCGLFGAPGLMALALIPVAYLGAAIRFRRTAYAVEDGLLFVRRGILGQRTYIVPIEKIQSTDVQQNPFDRRLGLCQVSIDTASQPLWDRPSIPDIDLAVGRELARTLAADAARRVFRW